MESIDVACDCNIRIVWAELLVDIHACPSSSVRIFVNDFSTSQKTVWHWRISRGRVWLMNVKYLSSISSSLLRREPTDSVRVFLQLE